MNKFFFLLLSLCLFFCLGCEPEEEAPQGSGLGDVFVRVLFNNQPVEGATITTDPETTEFTTDELVVCQTLICG